MMNRNNNLTTKIYCILISAFALYQPVAAQINLPCTPTPAGMIAWYPGDGNAVDIQSANNGSLQNGASFTTAAQGKAREAFTFDGNDDRIQINSAGIAKGQSALTLSAWVRPLGAHGSGFNFGGAVFNESIGTSANNTRFGVFIFNDGRVTLFGRSNDSAVRQVTTTRTIPLNQWTHIAASWDAATGLKIFINAELAASLNIAAGTFANTNSQFISLGTDYTGTSGDDFNGNIDELSLFNRTLAPHEILAIYNSGANGKCKPIANQFMLVSTFNGSVGGAGSVRKYDAQTLEHLGDLVSLGSGGLTNATGMFFDGANTLYVGSYGNSLFKKYDILSGAYLGNLNNGGGGLNGAGGIGRGPDARYYANSVNNHSILIYDLTTGTYDSTFVPTGSGGLNTPTGWTFGPDNNLYVVSAGTNQVLRYNGTTGAFIDVFISTNLNNPRGILFRENFVYVANYGNNQIVRFNAVTGAFDSVFAVGANGNEEMSFDANGNLIVAASLGGGAVRKFSGTNGALLQTFTAGTGPIDVLFYNAPCLNTPLGQVAFYTADGTAEDAQGANDGELKNGAFYGAGRVGSAAFDFDGVDDFVNAPDASALNFGTGEFSIETWVNFNSTLNEQVLVEKFIETGGSTATGYSLTKLPDNRIRLVFSTGTFVESAPLALASNVWYYIAGTRDAGGAVSIYLNGVSIASGTNTNDVNSVSSLKIAHRGNPTDTPGSNDTRGFYLNGKIDELSIYNTALSPADILNVYKAGKGGKCKPALAVNDLSLAVTSSSAHQNQNFTLTATVTNHTATTANGVILSAALPANLNFVSADAGCAYNDATRRVTCAIAEIGAQSNENNEIGNDFAPSAAVSRNIVVQPTGLGALQTNFTVTASEADTSVANNFFAANVNVLAPTAAGVAVGGRVTTADGRGIRNAQITLTEMNGTSRTVLTGNFGHYRFDDTETSQTVILRVSAKRFRFVPNALVVNVTEDINNADFTAQP